MKKFALFIALVSAISSSSFADSGIVYLKAKNTDQPSQMQMKGMNKNCIALHHEMRQLWIEHVIWTREYINSAIANLPDKDAVAARLMQNQEDIGDTISSYYGKSAGEKLTSLLKQHIAIAVDLVSAAIAGNKANIKMIDQKWHHNASAIAAFLSSANPYWERSKVVDMLNKHLSLTTDEVTDRIKQDWKGNIKDFDKILKQAIRMADTLSLGIAKQFIKDCFKELKEESEV